MSKRNEVIKAIICKPGEDPKQDYLNISLESLQEFVGGYFEVNKYFSNLAVICNEEGKLRGLPYSITITGIDYVGPVAIVGLNRAGNLADIKYGIDRLVNMRLIVKKEVLTDDE